MLNTDNKFTHSHAMKKNRNLFFKLTWTNLNYGQLGKHSIQTEVSQMNKYTDTRHLENFPTERNFRQI